MTGFIVRVNMKIINKGILSNLSAYFISSIVVSLISLMINPLLAMKLTSMDYAILGYYSSFVLLMTPIVSLSLQSYYARMYFRLEELERKEVYDTLMTLFSTIGLILFGLFFIIFYVYHRLCVESIPFSPYAILMFIPVYLSSFYNLFLVDLRMRGEGKKYALVSICNSIISAIFSILLVYVFNTGAIGRVWAVLIASIIFFAYSIIIKKVNLNWNVAIIKDSLLFCWPLIVTGILSYFFLGVDRPLLEKLNDTTSLGLYNIGLQISGYLGIFGTVLLQTFDPDLYKFTASKDHKKVIIICLVVLITVSLPNIVFIFCSDIIIYLLTAGRYVDSVPFANIMCLKNITATFAFMMSGVLIGYGFSKYELLNRFIGAGISILLYYIFISNFGFLGAAWGQCLSWLLMGLITIISLLILFKKNGTTIEHNSTGL